MKKNYSPPKFFRIKKNILATLCALIISEFTFAQLSAEDSLFQEAKYYLDTGYYESAINSLEKLLELNPNSAEAYGLLGNAFNKQGKHEKAIEMYHKCLEIDSTMLPVYENLGNAYIDAGKFSLAISIHKDLLSKDSTNIRHHINLGDAYMKQGYNSSTNIFSKSS